MKPRDLEERGNGIDVGFTFFTKEDIIAAVSKSNNELLQRSETGLWYKGELSGTTVAIKIPAKRYHERYLAETYREDDLAKRFAKYEKFRGHRNLCRLIGICQQLGAFVYEYLPGGNLRGRLACKETEKPLTCYDRIRIACEVSSALAFLHYDGIVHGEVTPENILFDANEVSKLSGLGPRNITYERILFDANEEPELSGLGPHNFTNLARYDVRDFGALLLELLTDEPEPSGKSNDQQLLDIKAKWPVEVAGKLFKLARRCVDLAPRAGSVFNELQSIKEQLHYLKDAKISADVEPRPEASMKPHELKEPEKEASMKPHKLGEPGKEIDIGFTYFTKEDIITAIYNSDNELIHKSGVELWYKGELSGATVAIKFVFDMIPAPERDPDNFRKYQGFGGLYHPNLCPLIGVCGELGAFVYEYLPGGNLRDRLACKNSEKPLTCHDLIRIACEICFALVFLHSHKPRGIFHGDIRSAHVLFDANGVAKLSGLGPHSFNSAVIYDVENFGELLLELINIPYHRLRSIDENWLNSRWLHRRCCKMLHRRIFELGRRCCKMLLLDLASVLNELESIKEQLYHLNDTEADKICTPKWGKELVPERRDFSLSEAVKSLYGQKFLHYLKHDVVSNLGILVNEEDLRTRLFEAFMAYITDSRAMGLWFDHVIQLNHVRQLGFLQYANSIQDLQWKIREDLGITGFDIETNAQKAIFNKLKDKHFLVFFHDLKKASDLKQLGIPGSDDGDAPGSYRRKVIFTTTNKAIFSKMEAKAFEINFLKQEEAWDLFYRSAGEGTIIPHSLIESLAKEIVERCSYLPLALVTAGRALHAEKDPHQWLHALSLLADTYPFSFIRDDISPLLKLSYDLLRDSNLQECFLCCLFWPEDYSISKEELISCWIGLGLIKDHSDTSTSSDGSVHQKDANEAYYQGYSFLDTLQSKGLVEYGSDETTVKVQDIVCDLALSLKETKHQWVVRASVQDGVNNMETLKSAQRVSLMDTRTKELLKEFLACDNLSALMLNMNEIKRIPPGFFRRMLNLTYLDLSHTLLDKLPSEISLLNRLNYLNISSTKVRSLPSELAKLKEVKYFFLRHNDVADIPQNLISEMSSLRVLDAFPHATIDVEFLKEKNLEAIGMVCFSATILDSIQSIAIRWLRVCRQKGLTSLEVLQVFSNKISKSLHELEINDCDALEKLVFQQKEPALGSFCQIVFQLQVLKLMYLNELYKVHWSVDPAECLKNLRILVISYCPKLENITWASQLPRLTMLSLRDCNRMKRLIITKGKRKVSIDEKEPPESCFASLQVMELMSLPKLCSIADYSMNFPSLRSVSITGCKNLKCLPFHQNMANNKILEIKAPAAWWKALKWESKETWACFQSCFKEHPDYV